VEQLVTHGGAPAVVAIDGGLHHAAAEPAQAGGALFGHVIAAMPIDQAFAQSLGEATQDEVVLVATGVLGSTLRGSQSPWPSLQSWRDAGGRTDRAMAVVVGAQRFAAREVPLSERPALSAIVARSRDDASEPLRRLRGGLTLIALAGVAVAVAGAFWITRSVRGALLAR
ncbi:MAG: hypothetical protein ACRD26_11805, partial [Vicinamibacterales bacterium]